MKPCSTDFLNNDLEVEGGNLDPLLPMIPELFVGNHYRGLHALSESLTKRNATMLLVGTTTWADYFREEREDGKVVCFDGL